MEKIEIGEVIGAGTFGTVYSGMYESKEIAVKFLYGGPPGSLGAHPQGSAPESMDSREPEYSDTQGSDDESEGSQTSSEGSHSSYSGSEEESGSDGEFQPKGQSLGFGAFTKAEMEVFRKEYRLMKAVCHENVLKVHGAAKDDNGICMITDLLKNGSLYDVLHRGIRFSEGLCLRFSREMCHGLMSIHSGGILHRDIKGKNILVSDDWRPVICDLGVSRVFSMRSQTMTAERGTINWMSPEVMREERYGFPADVYSLAMVMFETITGTVPFGKMNQGQIVFRVAMKKERPEWPEPPCHPLWVKLIEDCWAEDPHDRPTLEDVLKRLDEIEEILGDVAKDIHVIQPKDG